MKRTNKQRRRGTRRVKGGGFFDIFKSAKVAQSENNQEIPNATHIPIASLQNIPNCVTRLNELFDTNDELKKIVEYKKTVENKKTNNDEIKRELFTINIKSQEGKEVLLNIDEMYAEIENPNSIIFEYRFENVKNNMINIETYPPKILVETHLKYYSGLNYLYRYISRYCKIFYDNAIFRCKYKDIDDQLKICNKESKIDEIISAISNKYNDKIISAISKKYNDEILQDPNFWVSIYENAYSQNCYKLSEIIDDIESKFDAIYQIYLELEKYNNMPVAEAQAAGKRKRNKSKKV